MMKRWIWLFVLGIGCGDCSDEPAAVVVDDAGSDVADVGFQDVSDVAPEPTNFPGLVEIAVVPGQTNYAPGDEVTVETAVLDVFGEPTDDYDVEITTDGGSVTEADGVYTLVEEGRVSFEACTLAPGKDGEPICNSDTVIVNAGPPTVSLDFPPPGAELSAEQFPDSIAVSGTVQDTFGTPVVYVNGVLVELEEDGGFVMNIAPRLGVNHIVVEATDGLSDDTASVHADVLWAERYDEVEPTRVAFDGAFQLKLGQSLLDDRTAPMEQPDGTTTFGDIADLMKLVVEHADLDGVVPDPVVDSAPTFLLRVPSVDVGTAQTEVGFTNAGIEIFLRLPSLNLDTEGALQVESTSVDLEGDISASVAALIDVKIEQGDDDTPIRVTIESVSVAVEEMSSNFMQAEANALFLIAAGALRGAVESLVVSALTDAFLDQIPALLEDVFTELGAAIAENVIPLDTGFGRAIELTIGGEITSVKTGDELVVDTRFEASSDAASGLHETRGLARFFPASSAPDFFDADFEVALHLQLLNGVLAVLWQSGILDIDVSEAIPIPVQEATITAELPPVARPPVRGEPFDAIIELGQLELSIDLNGRQDVYGVSLSAGVSLGFVDGTFSLSLAETPDVRAWVISNSGQAPILLPVQLRQLIISQLWPDIQSTISNGIAIQVPTFNLDALGSVAPALAGATLGLNGGRATSLRSGYIYVEGVLEGVVP